MSKTWARIGYTSTAWAFSRHSLPGGLCSAATSSNIASWNTLVRLPTSCTAASKKGPSRIRRKHSIKFLASVDAGTTSRVCGQARPNSLAPCPPGHALEDAAFAGRTSARRPSSQGSNLIRVCNLHFRVEQVFLSWSNILRLTGDH